MAVIDYYGPWLLPSSQLIEHLEAIEIKLSSASSIFLRRSKSVLLLVVFFFSLICCDLLYFCHRSFNMLIKLCRCTCFVRLSFHAVPKPWDRYMWQCTQHSKSIAFRINLLTVSPDSFTLSDSHMHTPIIRREQFIKLSVHHSRILTFGIWLWKHNKARPAYVYTHRTTNRQVRTHSENERGANITQIHRYNNTDENIKSLKTHYEYFVRLFKALLCACFGSLTLSPIHTHTHIRPHTQTRTFSLNLDGFTVCTAHTVYLKISAKRSLLIFIFVSICLQMVSS